MYGKTKLGDKKLFNSSNTKLVKKIKIICKELPKLTSSLEIEYKVIETNVSENIWGASITL